MSQSGCFWQWHLLKTPGNLKTAVNVARDFHIAILVNTTGGWTLKKKDTWVTDHYNKPMLCHDQHQDLQILAAAEDPRNTTVYNPGFL